MKRGLINIIKLYLFKIDIATAVKNKYGKNCIKRVKKDQKVFSKLNLFFN